MEKFSAHQIEQFLQIEREVVSSADHTEVSNNNFWDNPGDTISSITITTTMTGRANV